MTANYIHTDNAKNCDLVNREKQEFGQSSLKSKKFCLNKICFIKIIFKFNYEANKLLNDSISRNKIFKIRKRSFIV